MPDHKTIPKSTLLRFVDTTSNKFSYYDLDSHQIVECFPKKYNIYESYYPREFEKWLSGIIETPMGTLNKDIFNLLNNKSNYILDYEKIKDALIKIIAIQSLRMPEIYKHVMNPEHRKKLISDHIKKLNKTGKPTAETDRLIKKYMQEVDNNQNMRNAFFDEETANVAIDLMKKEYNNYFVKIAVIKEDMGLSFILTPSHYFSVGNIIFVPLSPYYAYMLIPKEAKEIKPNLRAIVIEGNELGNYQSCISITEQIMLSFIPECIKATEIFQNKHLISKRSFLQKLIDLDIIH